jgi:hypothetical protein
MVPGTVWAFQRQKSLVLMDVAWILAWERKRKRKGRESRERRERRDSIAYGLGKISV